MDVPFRAENYSLSLQLYCLLQGSLMRPAFKYLDM